MKKNLSLLVALALSSSLFGCNTNQTKPEETSIPTTEETKPTESSLPVAEDPKDVLSAKATDVQLSSLNLDSSNDLSSAKQKYCNQTLKLTGVVKEIEDNYVVLMDTYAGTYVVDVYMNAQDIASLEIEELITVVGNTNDEIQDPQANQSENTFVYKHYQMPEAYFIQDTYEYTGILKGQNENYLPAFNILMDTNEYNVLIYFKDGFDTSSLTMDQEIKFSSKCFLTVNGFIYRDAQIINA